ncbi:MAG TPA: protein kinase [Acetivibrio clariflavus]|nr:protein kinase [Acetivibrio clariflavus]
MEGRILGGRYELLEKIGGGGMALVYKAKCRLLNRFVAVKLLRPEFTTDEEFVKRFRVEAQAAASLSHPNIVSIYDVGQEDDLHYIVMEYVNGITLKEYIMQKGVLNWKEAVNIVIQICSAIEHAHKNHIVHRDIKPHNILLTKDGVAKVTISESPELLHLQP